MTRIALLLLTLFFTPALALAQEPQVADGTIIESADVTGLQLNQFSEGLRRDITALAGDALVRDRVAALAARIEAEKPDVVAAVRYLPQPDGRVRVVFVVARVTDNPGLAANINSRYVVDRVDIDGIADSKISQPLRDELQALVGHPLDDATAAQLTERLRAEAPDYEVHRSVSRGDDTGRVRVVFRFERSESSRWIPFTPTTSKGVYHGEQGWSGVLNIVAGNGGGRFTAGFVGGNTDDLIEEYSGYLLRFEAREAGTRRVGLGFEFSWYSQDWREQTLAALATTLDSARPYDERMTVEPTVKIALTQHLTLTGGVSLVELEPENLDISQRANAGIGSLGYRQRWTSGSRTNHSLEASYTFRGTSTSLDSDLIYTRHAARAHYEIDHRANTFVASFEAGHVSPTAPLFERFAIGDARTLRGWNKFEINPTGANRLWYQSVEYRFRGFAYFFDAGAAWNEGDEARVRLASGVGFHTKHVFLTVGIPLNADSLSGTFMMGIRF